MKTLYLLRHAKANWKDPDLADFYRPLNERGREAAPLVGRFIRRQKIRPDLLLCSPAERARQTADLVVESAELAGELRYDERIYQATGARLLDVVSQVDEQAGIALIFGHNPGFEELLGLLTGETHHMPTAALARVTLDVEKWCKARERAGHLDWLVRPREMKGF